MSIITYKQRKTFHLQTIYVDNNVKNPPGKVK